MTAYDDAALRVFAAKDRDGDLLEVFRPTVRPDGAVALLRLTPPVDWLLPRVRVWWIETDSGRGLRDALNRLLAEDRPPQRSRIATAAERIGGAVDQICADIAEVGDDVDAEVVLRLLARTTAALGDLLAALAGEQ